MPNGESVQFTKNEGTIFLPLIARAPELVPYRILQAILGRELNYYTSADMQQVRVWISRIRKKIGDTNLSPETAHGRFRIIKMTSGSSYRFDPSSAESLSLPVNPQPLIIEGTG